MHDVYLRLNPAYLAREEIQVDGFQAFKYTRPRWLVLLTPALISSNPLASAVSFCAPKKEFWLRIR